MIGVVIACLISAQTLAATGNEDDVWYIGDLDPSIVQFDSRKSNLDFAICKRTSKDTYIIQKLLQRRPLCLTRHKGQLWFVSNDTRGFSVYDLFIPKKSEPTQGRTSMKWTVNINAVATDMVVYDDNLVVCCGEECLVLLAFIGNSFIELPVLCEQPNARVVNVDGHLVAAVPSDLGVTLWTLTDAEWVIGNTIALQGSFTQIITKDGMILLVSQEEQQGHILGIQLEIPIEIAAFDIPKGRWSVVPSPQGLSVIGVERNGTTTVIDIGWPSGKTSEAIELYQDTRHLPSVFTRYPILLAALLVSVFLFLRLRRSIAKRAKKEGF